MSVFKVSEVESNRFEMNRLCESIAVASEYVERGTEFARKREETCRRRGRMFCHLHECTADDEQSFPLQTAGM